jgi:hypothetical protein
MRYLGGAKGYGRLSPNPPPPRQAFKSLDKRFDHPPGGIEDQVLTCLNIRRL